MIDLDSLNYPFHNKTYKKAKMDQKNKIVLKIRNNKLLNLSKKITKRKILKIKYSKPKIYGHQNVNNKTIM